MVGAGISGVACARVLSKAGIEVEIRDRSHGPGGRMSSPRMTWSSLGDRRIDTGAGYFTVRDDEFRTQVDDWLARGLAREWTDTFHLLPAADGSPGLGNPKPGPMRYAAPGGLRSSTTPAGTPTTCGATRARTPARSCRCRFTWTAGCGV